MRPTDSPASPIDLPAPIIDLCAHLESRGLPAYSHGEGLLAQLRRRVPDALAETPPSADPAHSLLCVGTAQEILAALPRAVVTSEARTRLTQPTESGPVDLIVVGRDALEKTLTAFGLGPLGFAFRPADLSWVDPDDQKTAFIAGRLELMHTDPNPFWVAPRRYWIAARLLSENRLRPTEACLEAACAALESVAARLPQAAPARREVERILRAPDPEVGLAFLRESGVGVQLFPGTKPANEARIARLPELPAVRWAAWLRGSATARVLVRLRTPHALSKRIERVQANHPIDRIVETGRDHGIRKLMQRLSKSEIDALIAWRRLELEAARDPAEAEAVEQKLRTIEERIREALAAEERTTEIKALAFDGAAVMEALGAGPGRHVGQALRHLSHFVKDHPEKNDEVALRAELVDWAQQNTNLLD